MKYLMKHKILYLCVAVAAMFSACSDDLENSTFTISEEVPAATWLQENGYSQWVALLNHTNMFSTINLNVGDYTLFVPDNEAVNKYLAANGYGSVQDIDPAYGQYLVKYHTIAGNQYSQVDFTNDVLPDTTATGDRLSVTFNEDGDYFVNEEAKITSFDVATTNATIFIMDGVLTPITEYIYDRLEDNADWSLFKELLDATGITPLVSSTAGRAATYTCLVVPNSVFNAASINSLSALADTLGAGQNTAAWTDTENAMYRYAAYHLISSSHATGSIVVADTASSTSAANVLATLAEASYIEFQDIDGQLYINYDTLTQTGATWGEVTDLVCRNGVIHEVSTPLYIKAPTNVPTTTFEVTDFSILETEISEYRLGSLTAEYVEDLLPLREQYGSNFCYDWTSLLSSTGSNCVSYYVGTQTDTVGLYFTNHDALLLNLGQYGYIDMQTPSLVADSTTYSVGLSFYNTAASSASGRFTIYIDGEPVGSLTTQGGTVPDRFDDADTKPEEWVAIPDAESGEYIVGEITLATTGRHTLRIEDNEGSTLYLDYVLFTPKK